MTPQPFPFSFRYSRQERAALEKLTEITERPTMADTLRYIIREAARQRGVWQDKNTFETTIHEQQ